MYFARARTSLPPDYYARVRSARHGERAVYAAAAASAATEYCIEVYGARLVSTTGARFIRIYGTHICAIRATVHYYYTLPASTSRPIGF